MALSQGRATAADELDIMELVARYNHAIDHRRADDFAAVFAPEGELWADGALRARGTAALAEHIRKAERTGQQIRHWPCNPLVRVSGDAATLRMYVLAWDVTGGGMRAQIMAEYDDALARVDGRWKFTVRRVSGVAGNFPPHVANNH